MNKKILHHSRYLPNAFGHGGERRTTQIIEYYIQEGFEIVSLQLDFKKKFSISSLFKALFILIRVYGLCQWKSVNKFRKYWRDIARLLPQLERYFSQDIDVFVWESVLDEYYYLAYIAQKYNKKVIAFPHNIESLVLNQRSALTNKLSPSGFDKEIFILKNCDSVYTISRFDLHLLTLFGVSAEFFAYEPPLDVRNFLCTIKEKRNAGIRNEIKQLFVIGTAHNPPTRVGLEKLIDICNKCVFGNFIVRIAGFGTEVFKEKVINSRVEIIGELSQKELEVEMINCDALIVNQPATTGALTRVTEFLFANIPVFLNIESAHSHFNVNGVKVYESLDDLSQLVEQVN